ncbi:MAG: MCE family protein [Campylobacterales bacterium]|nr:MCE family protein [Campylobacterales bacterium]
MSVEPIKKRPTVTYVVWVIPLLAVFLAFWMLYKFYSEQGEEIVVTFKDGSGLIERKSLLKYKGTVVGHVTDIALSADDISKVDVTFSVSKNAIKAVAREGNEFWKVKPKVTLTEVSGLETIVGGLYVEIFPADKTIEGLQKLAPKYRFVASDQKPVDHLHPGLTLVLHDREGRFGIDTPVIYKKFIVGRISERNLVGEGVEYVVYIDAEYKHLINTQTKFWGIEGVEFKASLAGVSLKVDSLASLVAGGITFESPSCDGLDCIPEPSHNYLLYNDRASTFYDARTITLRAAKAWNIDPQLSLIYHKGVEAGKIESLAYDPKSETTLFEIRLKGEFARLIKDEAYFWVVAPQLSLSGVSGLDAIAKGPYISFEAVGESSVNGCFKLHESPPRRKGTVVTLEAQSAGSLRVGSVLYYKAMEAGTVEALRLGGEGVEVDVRMDEAYAHLLRDESLFYELQAVQMRMGADGFEFKAATLGAMLQGGIGFETPSGAKALSKSRFTLYPDSTAAHKARYFKEQGVQITLTCKDAKGLSAGAPLYYQGFKAGEVLSSSFDPSRGESTLTLFVASRFAAHLPMERARFYYRSAVDLKVDFPNVSLHVGELGGLLGGAVAFELHPEADAPKVLRLFEDRDEAFDEDYRATLWLSERGGLKEGSKIYYKGVEIGRIEAFALANDGVEARLRIERAHADLMREDTIISLGAFGFSLEQGLQNPSALISGESLHVSPGSAVKQGSYYRLKDADALAKIERKGLRLVLSAPRRGSLKEGSPLFYRQIKIGDVESFRLSDDMTQVEFLVYIDPCYAHIVREHSRFYQTSALGVELGFSGLKIRTETLETMMSGGIAVLTPDEPGAAVAPMRRFALFDEAQESWLSWAPKLRGSDPMCQ